MNFNDIAEPKNYVFFEINIYVVIIMLAFVTVIFVLIYYLLAQRKRNLRAKIFENTIIELENTCYELKKDNIEKKEALVIASKRIKELYCQSRKNYGFNKGISTENFINHIGKKQKQDENNRKKSEFYSDFDLLDENLILKLGDFNKKAFSNAKFTKEKLIENINLFITSIRKIKIH